MIKVRITMKSGEIIEGEFSVNCSMIGLNPLPNTIESMEILSITR